MSWGLPMSLSSLRSLLISQAVSPSVPLQLTHLSSIPVSSCWGAQEPRLPCVVFQQSSSLPHLSSPGAEMQTQQWERAAFFLSAALPDAVFQQLTSAALKQLGGLKFHMPQQIQTGQLICYCSPSAQHFVMMWGILNLATPP